jgi:glycosyltransferase involved in cell wall biosynthesis
MFAAAVLMRAVGHVERFDIVDCNATPYLHIPSTWVLARRSRARMVLTTHEALSAALPAYFRERGSRMGQQRVTVLQKGYRWLHSLPDAVVASSELTAHELQREGIATLAVTHGGVSAIGATRTSYRGRMVGIGRLVPLKRFNVVIEAFAIAHAAGDATHLTIIGDGPELPALRRLADAHSVANVVSFLGGIEEDEKLRVLREASDVYVSASIREGLSIATLEALGAGAPAVVSSRPDLSVNGALEYMADDVNGFVTDGEATSIAAAVRVIAADPHRFARLSSAAIATARRYSWETAAAELETAYECVLRAPRFPNWSCVGRSS